MTRRYYVDGRVSFCKSIFMAIFVSNIRAISR